ncbi:SDR family oxidoreductase [Sphingobacterium spiritivorum]|uniref:SDR family oxidoreductase n=1 Tax=Sphingobacterium spiritivorum TaxID=258 RepID=UPI003DA24450
MIGGLRRDYLIYGISKGLGKALAKHLPQAEDLVYGISRNQPDYLQEVDHKIEWIAADLANPAESSESIRHVIGSNRIDYLIYNVGIWEHNAFSDEYDFKDNTKEEILTMINTNISSCLLAVQSFTENLKKSENAKIILIGSTWGLENHSGKEVTFSATKFALRGIVHALRENLREYGIGVSILNLGYLATEFDYEEDLDKVLEQTHAELIPLQDVMAAIQFILSTSKASCVKEITMPAMKDTNV